VRCYYLKRKPFEHPFRYGYGMLDPWASKENVKLYQRYRALYKKSFILNNIFRFKYYFEAEALQNRLRHVLKENELPKTEAEKTKLLIECTPEDSLLSKNHQTYYEPYSMQEKKKERRFRTL